MYKMEIILLMPKNPLPYLCTGSLPSYSQNKCVSLIFSETLISIKIITIFLLVTRIIMMWDLNVEKLSKFEYEVKKEE